MSPRRQNQIDHRFFGKISEKTRGVSTLVLDHGAWYLYLMATIVIVTGILRGQTSIARYFSLLKSKQVLEEAVNAIKSENDSLESEIFKIKESKAYARKVLREKYHVTEEDEKIFYFAD